MQVVNVKIRKAAKRHGVRLWELAHYMNCSEAALYRRLRYQLPEEEENKWLQAIEELAEIEPEDRPAHLFGMG